MEVSCVGVSECACVWGWLRNRMVSKRWPHDTNTVGTHLLPRIRESYPLAHLLHLCPDSLLTTKGLRTKARLCPSPSGRAPRSTPKSGIWLWGKVKPGQAPTGSLKAEESGLERKVGTGAGGGTIGRHHGDDPPWGLGPLGTSRSYSSSGIHLCFS